MNPFKKATRKKSKLRLALFGVSGGGKTLTALRIAKGIAGESGKIALIDTENHSAEKYSGIVNIRNNQGIPENHSFEFDTVDLETATINNVIMYINEAGKAGYDVLIIDSLTHTWLELLQEVEKIARSKFGGNTWSAWSEGTPKQQQLIKAILNYPGHVIATMRVETNWSTATNEKGKMVPVRTGEAPKGGKGIEYEFDMLISLSQDHVGHVLKDRTGKYQDEMLSKPDESFGESLRAWLECDSYPEVKTSAEPQETKKEEIIQETKTSIPIQDPVKEFTLFLKNQGLSVEQIKGYTKSLGITSKDTEIISQLLKDVDNLKKSVKEFINKITAEFTDKEIGLHRDIDSVEHVLN